MATNVYYSVCPFGTGSLLTAAGSTHATIVVDSSGNATITLNDDSLVDNIGRGVCVEYNSVVSYIDSITDYTHFHLTDEHGASRGAQSSTALTSVHHVWGSLSDGEAGASGAAFLTTTKLTSESAASGGAVLNLYCYYDHDDDTTDGAATISSWTESSTQFIRVYVPKGASGESVKNNRHTGKWSTNAYRIVGSTDGLYYVREGYTETIGLQVGMSNADAQNYAVMLVAAVSDGILFDSCISRGDLGAVLTRGRCFYVTAVSAGTINIRNSIFCGNARGYNAIVGVNDADVTVNVYNCTITDGHRGVDNVAATAVVVKNCAIFNTGDDSNGTITMDYCATDDGDGTNAVDISPGGTEADDWAAAFTDYANGDFSVKDTDSVLYDAGTDLSGTFTTDIKGTTRSSWDIGAFEYVAPAAAGGIIPIIMNHLQKMRAN